MPQLFIIKICFTIKINSVCSVGQDTWNLRHKFNSQGHALRILGLRVTIANSQGLISRVLGVRVQCSRVPTPRVPGLRVSGSWVSGSWGPGSQVSGPGSQVLILDYAEKSYQIKIFASMFMNICDDFSFPVSRMNSTFYSVPKLKYRNLNSYFHLLILLSGDISLNSGPTHQHKLQCLNEQNLFKSRGLHFIHLNINSLLPKIEELRIIAKSFNRSSCPEVFCKKRCSYRTPLVAASELMPRLQVSVNLNQMSLY